MVQMTFKLNCAPEAGSLKNGLHNAITSKIGRQMGAFHKNAFITFSGYNGPFRANWHIVTATTRLFYALCRNRFADAIIRLRTPRGGECRSEITGCTPYTFYFIPIYLPALNMSPTFQLFTD